ncbi:hypothetical protein FDECE_7972 [Fusarium decemcellulare]|nr:hypothetical protein FDECE_7972 [Fusarium decemcellulare]
MAPKYLNKLQGKSVLVVGGTSGIGYAVAEACIEFQASVTIASRTQDKVDSAVKCLVSSYPDARGRIQGHVVDLHGSDVEASLVKLFDFASNKGGTKLDHVIETVGEALATSPSFQQSTADHYIEFSRTRVFGVAMLGKIAARYLKQDPSSSFTLTGGTSAYKPAPGWLIASYLGGAKDGLSKGFAVEMNPVRVNLVSPGPIQTEFFDTALKAAGDQAEVVRDVLREKSLLGTFGTPEDVAEAYLSLVKNAYVTGTTLHVEGGLFLK